MSEPSVPLSAIRALVQQWEDEIAALQALDAETVSPDVYVRTWRRVQCLRECLPELAALCPAPPEEPK